MLHNNIMCAEYNDLHQTYQMQNLIHSVYHNLRDNGPGSENQWKLDERCGATHAGIVQHHAWCALNEVTFLKHNVNSIHMYISTRICTPLGIIKKCRHSLRLSPPPPFLPPPSIIIVSCKLLLIHVVLYTPYTDTGSHCVTKHFRFYGVMVSCGQVIALHCSLHVLYHNPLNSVVAQMSPAPRM